MAIDVALVGVTYAPLPACFPQGGGQREVQIEVLARYRYTMRKMIEYLFNV